MLHYQTKRFILDEMRPAFSVDELTTSRPIIREVNSQAEIGQMFDTISYNKVRNRNVSGSVCEVEGELGKVCRPECGLNSMS